MIASDLSPGHGARLTVDLAALVANWRALAARAPHAECGAVVKADAYGCGLSAVAPALARAGCRTVFVAHLSEGIAARKLLPEAAIYVLNGLPPGAGAAFAGHALRPVLGDREELAEWAAVSDGRLLAALHVDTGMNRLGLSVAQALELAGDPVIGQAGIDLVMSHLVSAECPADPINVRQAADFARLRAAFPRARASLANSSGTWLAGDTRHDLLRPGYALFGGNPEPGRPNPMRPVVRLEATILQIRHVEAGETCGYNARWTAPGPRRLATLSLGYADGYPRAASGRGRALVGGVPCPILGLISMDLIILDVTDAPAARRGGTATLIGDRLDIDTVGQAAGTIGYEILTGLGSRYVRNYVE
ncbi:alanine racemase [Methylorubrum sp. POS3]